LARHFRFVREIRVVREKMSRQFRVVREKMSRARARSYTRLAHLAPPGSHPRASR
jgi:hypothetical protein